MKTALAATAMLAALAMGCAGTDSAGDEPGAAEGLPASPGAGAGGAPPERVPVSTTGSIVPLYTPPEDASWAAIAAAKRLHPPVPVVAVVNPANGPGAAETAAYTDGIATLEEAGIKVIGYVATGYTARGQAAVEADIERWKAFYPHVQGIFFDEQANKPGSEDFYRQVVQHARAQGFPFTVGNPGTDTGPGYVGIFDADLIYESAGAPTLATLGGWHSDHPRGGFGIIPYATSFDAAYVQAAKAHVGWIYLTDDNMPNPWDTLSSFFPQLLAALE